MRPVLDVPAFVAKHRASVWTYLRLLGCDATEADDLTQETLLVVLQRSFQERSDAASRSFLRRTARQLYLASRRDETRREAILRAEAAEAVWQRRMPRDTPEEYLAALRSCLQQLADRTRRAIRMRYQEQRDGKEIGSVLGLTEGATNTLLHRARQRLRLCIERKIEP
jgi:RNA polymerase sigma-70 factor (ECF subfamily)